MKSLKNILNKNLILIICISMIFFAGSKVSCYADENNSAADNEYSNAVKADEINVSVTDIQISSEFQNDIEVGKAQSLSASVVPTNATDQVIKYKSSNTSVAQVSQTGEVKGISKGSAVITLSAGKVTKSVSVNVKVATTSIEVNNTYVVLKSGMQNALKANAMPKEADQNLSFSSSDSNIASVSQSGVITAKAVGSTTVLVSNSDYSAAVSVIVNDGENPQIDNNTANKSSDSQVPLKLKENSKSSDSIAKLFADKNKKAEINAADYKEITKDSLKYLFENKLTLIVRGKGYVLTIDGSKIVNYDNNMFTAIKINNDEEGKSFVVNEGKNLPGTISISFDKKMSSGKYLYLYNKTKKKYLKLNDKCSDVISIDIAGKYMLTDHKISNIKSKPVIICVVLGSIGALSGLGVYIFIKKKYWFW